MVFMSLQRILVFAIALLSVSSLAAQPLHWMGQRKPYKWQFGIGWNAVDDDGRGFCQAFDVQQSWNIPVFPSRFMVDRYLKYGLSVEFAGAYNEYTENKLINGMTGQSGLFLSGDLNCKFSFYQLLQIQWLDPYASLGIGGTHRDAYDQTFVGTLNASVGVNFWVYRNWGIQLQSSGKLGVGNELLTGNTNYIQHTAGIVYKLQERSWHTSPHKKRYKWTKSKPRYRGGRRSG